MHGLDIFDFLLEKYAVILNHILFFKEASLRLRTAWPGLKIILNLKLDKCDCSVAKHNYNAAATPHPLPLKIRSLFVYVCYISCCYPVENAIFV